MLGRAAACPLCKAPTWARQIEANCTLVGLVDACYPAVSSRVNRRLGSSGRVYPLRPVKLRVKRLCAPVQGFVPPPQKLHRQLEVLLRCPVDDEGPHGTRLDDGPQTCVVQDGPLDEHFLLVVRHAPCVSVRTSVAGRRRWRGRERASLAIPLGACLAALCQMPNLPAPSESAPPLRNASSQTARRGADSESDASESVPNSSYMLCACSRRACRSKSRCRCHHHGSNRWPTPEARAVPHRLACWRPSRSAWTRCAAGHGLQAPTSVGSR
eukprot:scaffold616_cov120-Isochrysis_galbana.AAC.1